MQDGRASRPETVGCKQAGSSREQRARWQAWRALDVLDEQAHGDAGAAHRGEEVLMLARACPVAFPWQLRLLPRRRRQRLRQLRHLRRSGEGAK